MREAYPSDKGCGFYYKDRPENHEYVSLALYGKDFSSAMMNVFNRANR